MSWGVGGGEISFAGERPDFCFGEERIAEWGDDREFFSSMAAGANLLHIVGIFAVSDRRIVSSQAKCIELAEEFCFAEVAAVEWVAGVLRIGEFVGGDDLDSGTDLGGEGEGIVKGLARETGAIGDHGEDLGAEDGVGFSEEKRAIDPATVGDD